MHDPSITVIICVIVIFIIVIALFLSYVIIMNDAFTIVLVCLIRVFAFTIRLFITTVVDGYVTFIHVEITHIFDDLQIIQNVFYVFMSATRFDDFNQHANPLLSHTNYFIMQQTIYR